MAAARSSPRRPCCPLSARSCEPVSSRHLALLAAPRCSRIAAGSAVVHVLTGGRGRHLFPHHTSPRRHVVAQQSSGRKAQRGGWTRWRRASARERIKLLRHRCERRGSCSGGQDLVAVRHEPGPLPPARLKSRFLLRSLLAALRNRPIGALSTALEFGLRHRLRFGRERRLPHHLQLTSHADHSRNCCWQGGVDSKQ